MLGVKRPNQTMEKLNMIKSVFAGKSPQDVYESMLSTNPQFQEFVKANQGKTIDEIAMEYDVDLNILKNFM